MMIIIWLRDLLVRQVQKLNFGSQAICDSHIHIHLTKFLSESKDIFQIYQKIWLLNDVCGYGIFFY